jgi:hypothetical protein
MMATPLRLGFNRKRPFSFAPSLPPVSTTKKQKQKHWTILRSSTTRGLKKEVVSDDKDIDQEEVRLEREPMTADWGCFPHLTGHILEGSPKDVSSINHEETVGILRSLGTAQKAQAYLGEIIYGGCVGLGVTRSMWEYCTYDERDEQDDFKLKVCDLNVTSLISLQFDVQVFDLFTRNAMRSIGVEEGGSLGMPLVEYVRREVINPLTGGLHEDLYQAGLSLNSAGRESLEASGEASPSNVDTVFTLLPHILGILKQEVDMACSILSPNETLARGDEQTQPENFDDSSLATIRDKNNQCTSSQTDVGSSPKPDRFEREPTSDVTEIRALLQYLLDYTGKGILEIDHRIRQAGKGAPKFSYEDDVHGVEDIKSEEQYSWNREDLAPKAIPGDMSVLLARDQGGAITSAPDDSALEQIRLHLLALETKAQDNAIATSPEPTHAQPSTSAPSP